MENFYTEEKEICISCDQEAIHIILFEEVEPGHEEIIYVCVLCGAASFRGERVFGEEFYY